MPVYRDVSDPSILVGCTDCPYWFAMRFSEDESWTAAENHKIQIHDVMPSEARKARKIAERRARQTVS